MKRDVRGCRIYARIPDANGSSLLVKQATTIGGRHHGNGTPTDRVWLFLERSRVAAATEPLLTPDGVRALIDALQLHLKHMNEGPDTASPPDDWVPTGAEVGAKCAVCGAQAVDERRVRLPGTARREVPVLLCRDHIQRTCLPEALIAAAQRALKDDRT